MSGAADLRARLARLDAMAEAESSWRHAVKRLAEARGLAVDHANVERAVQDIYRQAEEARG
jgi:hypothetical protein